MSRLYRDLPRGRKRHDWKKEFLESLAEMANDIGEVSEEEVLRTAHSCAIPFGTRKALSGEELFPTY
jgi:hypothetical protein